MRQQCRESARERKIALDKSINNKNKTNKTPTAYLRCEALFHLCVLLSSFLYTVKCLKRLRIYAAEITIIIIIVTTIARYFRAFWYNCTSIGQYIFFLKSKLGSSAGTRVFRIPSFPTKSSCQRSFSYQALTIWREKNNLKQE